MNRATLVVAIATLLVVADAHANVAAPEPDQQALLSGLRPTGKTPLVVEQERLVFRCTERAVSGSKPECHFRAEYDIVNPTTTDIVQPAAFVGIRTPHTRLTVDGRDVARSLSKESTANIEEMVGRVEFDSIAQLHGLEIVVAAGQRLTLVAEGVTHPGERGLWPGGYVVSGNRGRHWLLGDDERTRPTIRHAFEYLVAPIHSWGAVGDIMIEVHYDPAWDLEGGLSTDDPQRPHIPFEPADDVDGLAVARMRTSGREKGNRLVMDFADVPVPIYHGGPIVGIGGDLGDDGGFRMRFGWEFAAPELVGWSVVVDTDYTDDVVLAPSIDLLLPHIYYVIPSLSLGAGVPIRLVPETDVGVRFQAAITWFPVGFATSFDVYPGIAKDNPRFFDATLLARFSL